MMQRIPATPKMVSIGPELDAQDIRVEAREDRTGQVAGERQRDQVRDVDKGDEDGCHPPDQPSRGVTWSISGLMATFSAACGMPTRKITTNAGT